MKITMDDERLGKLVIEKDIVDYDDCRVLFKTILLWMTFSPEQVKDIIGGDNDET